VGGGCPLVDVGALPGPVNRRRGEGYAIGAGYLLAYLSRWQAMHSQDCLSNLRGYLAPGGGAHLRRLSDKRRGRPTTAIPLVCVHQVQALRTRALREAEPSAPTWARRYVFSCGLTRR
jgi:hypothetical protein